VTQPPPVPSRSIGGMVNPQPNRSHRAVAHREGCVGEEKSTGDGF
jgi:hypothetical protein